MIPLWEVFALGIVLGIRHAFDADHLVAVSTIVSEYRNPFRAIWIGVSWGLGHTTTLFLVGLLILLAGIALPERAALFFEFLVGLVLVFLGLQIFWGFRREGVHLHPHAHEEKAHAHFHSHAQALKDQHHLSLAWRSLPRFLIAGIVPGEHRQEGWRGATRPFFRVKSYIVGTVHGLAGSAALMLLVLASLRSTWAGVTYILLFGLGSVVAMGVVTIFLTVPFSTSARLPRLNRWVQFAAGSFGILFGLSLMYQFVKSLGAG